MVETSSDIDTALSSALKEVNNALADQRTFAIVVETFRKRLLRDLDSSNAQAQSYFANLVSSVDAATQSIISKITSAAQAAASEVAGLRDVGFLAPSIIILLDGIQTEFMLEHSKFQRWCPRP